MPAKLYSKHEHLLFLSHLMTLQTLQTSYLTVSCACRLTYSDPFQIEIKALTLPQIILSDITAIVKSETTGEHGV